LDGGQREELRLAMTALAGGDRSAFRPVFTTLWPLLRRFCERTLHDPDAARDAAQTALMKLLLHATNFRVDGDVVAWALGFASFECLSVRNRTLRRREQVDDSLLAALPTGQPSPEDSAIHENLRAAAVQLLGTLRAQDVQTLSTALAGGRAVGSNAASRKRLQRAIERLRAAWRHTYGNND
jgi:DNA-directed RNA polymerase specialized sigma24 family protein